MYENYYGLKSKPFCLIPDPGFLFSSATYKRGLAYLRYGIERGEGIIVISGDAGTGKSFLIRSLLDDINDDEVIVGMLVSPSLDADELIQAVLTCFGIKPTHSKAEQLNRLKKYLVARAHENKRVILAVDEAHSLSLTALEELRMLSNFQLGERALLQMFLLGQSTLWDTLSGDNMVQFKQRIIAAHQMQPLSFEETQQYILSRLRKAGWDDSPTFNQDVFALIHNHCEGNPRKTNRLCDRILLQGLLEERAVVDQQLVNRAIDELSDELMEKRRGFSELHVPLAKNAQLHDQTASEAPFDLLFKTDKLKTEPVVKAVPVGDEAEKIANPHTSNRRRVLVALGSSGLLLMGGLYWWLDGGELPLGFDVAPQLHTSSLSSPLSVRPELGVSRHLFDHLDEHKATPSGRPLETRSFATTDDYSGGIDDVADITIRSSIPGEIEHSENLQPQIAESTPSILENRNVKSIERESTAFSRDRVAEGGSKAQLVDAVPVVEMVAARAMQPRPELIKPTSSAVISDQKPSLLVEKPARIVPDAQSKPRMSEAMPVLEKNIEHVAVKEGHDNDNTAFSHLISRFSSAYEMGDVDELVGLFSQDASTPESSDRDAIIDSYKKLFSVTEARRVVFRDVQWAQEGDHYIGQGRFEAAIREKGRRLQRSYYGEVEFHLENRDEKPIITYVAHDYDD